MELIYAERVRQITVKRRLPEDDVTRNTNGQLAMAGACMPSSPEIKPRRTPARRHARRD